MAHRREHVVNAVPDQHRARYRGQLEHPLPAERERIVDPAVSAVPDRFGVGVGEQPLDGHVVDDPPVGRRELRAEVPQQKFRIVADQPAALGQGFRDRVGIGVGASVPGRVRGRHALIPVQVRRVRGGETDQRRDALDPVAEQSSAGKCVRSTSRAADHAERADAQGIGDRRHVCRGVGDAPAGIPVGTAIAGPVVADKPDAQPVQDARSWPWSAPATGSAVQQEDRKAAVRCSDAVHSEVTPAWRGYRLCHSSLPRVSLIH